MAMRSENELSSANGCLNSNPKPAPAIQYANAVPSKPGFNQCEFCNIIAPVESFFSSSKRFCSCVCSRSFSSSMRDHGNSSKNNERRRLLLAKNMKKRAELQEMEKEKNSTLNRQFDWGEYLDREETLAAPVGSFPHCSRSVMFDEPFDLRKIEVVNREVNELDTVYWIATVIRAAGYFVKLRPEGYDDDQSRDFWLHLFTDEIHPLAWCALNNRELVIPPSLGSKKINWENYLRPRLSQSFSLADDFEECKEKERKFIGPLVPGMKVEVINKHNLSSMKVATVEKNRGGRLVLKYDDSQVDNNFFWCHSLSDVIHHIGWSCMVGHEIEASPEYKAESLRKVDEKRFDANDATPQMFEQVALMRRNQLTEPCKKLSSFKFSSASSTSLSSSLHSWQQHSHHLKFHSGMKLEVVDPSNPASICAATVVRVLRNDYIMVKKDSVLSFEQQNLQRDLFCFHARSAYILPAGFCLANDLELVPPKGYTGHFNWKDYVAATGSVVAQIGLFSEVAFSSHNKPMHKFEVDMKVEAANLLNPKQVCVATIKQIIGRLMKVQLENFEETMEQWMDVFSPDVCPTGWCQAHGHPLEAPRPKMTPLLNNKINKKPKKSSLTKSSRKRKRMKLDPHGDEDTSDQDDGCISNSVSESAEYEKAESGKDFLSESSPTYSPYGCGFENAKPQEKGKSSDDSDADITSEVKLLQCSETEKKNKFSQLSDEKFESKVCTSLFDSSTNASRDDGRVTFTSLKSGLEIDSDPPR